MKQMEQMELDKLHDEIIIDVKNLVEKYRTIFDWDIPEINQHLADKLILQEMRKALDAIETALPH